MSSTPVKRPPVQMRQTRYMATKDCRRVNRDATRFNRIWAWRQLRKALEANWDLYQMFLDHWRDHGAYGDPPQYTWTQDVRTWQHKLRHPTIQEVRLLPQSL